jgi:hypothetical protein
MLNARKVETISEPGRYVDDKGLCLVVSKTGRKTWVLRYQVAGRRRDMGLGSYPEVTLATAREKALNARRAIDDGKDPIAQRRAERSTSGLPTFRHMARVVIDLEQPKSTNEKVRYQWELLLGPRYCGPFLER